jgi:hypothetical protein
MTDINGKQSLELELVQRFLTDAEFQCTNLTASDRPDIIASMNGRNIGMEVTVFHSDEGSARQSNEGSLRQAGERNARSAPDSSYVMAVPTDTHAGLEARINDKITKAAQYDMSGIDELWLLIPAQQPSLGALPATFVFSFLIDVNELNRRFNENLLESRFNRVYWHLMSDHAIYGWDRSAGWQVVRQGNEPDKTGLEVLNRIRQRQSL